MDIRCIYRARSVLSEKVLWSPEEKALYWIDQMWPGLHRLDPATGKDRKIALDLPEQLGAADRARANLGALRRHIADQSGSRQALPLVNPTVGLPRASFNDAKCDRQGSLWAASADRLETETIGCLYHLRHRSRYPWMPEPAFGG